MDLSDNNFEIPDDFDLTELIPDLLDVFEGKCVGYVQYFEIHDYLGKLTPSDAQKSTVLNVSFLVRSNENDEFNDDKFYALWHSIVPNRKIVIGRYYEGCYVLFETRNFNGQPYTRPSREIAEVNDEIISPLDNNDIPEQKQEIADDDAHFLALLKSIQDRRQQTEEEIPQDKSTDPFFICTIRAHLYGVPTELISRMALDLNIKYGLVFDPATSTEPTIDDPVVMAAIHTRMPLTPLESFGYLWNTTDDEQEIGSKLIYLNVGPLNYPHVIPTAFLQKHTVNNFGDYPRFILAAIDSLPTIARFLTNMPIERPPDMMIDRKRKRSKKALENAPIPSQKPPNCQYKDEKKGVPTPPCFNTQIEEIPNIGWYCYGKKTPDHFRRMTEKIGRELVKKSKQEPSIGEVFLFVTQQ